MRQYILLLAICFSILFAYFFFASSQKKISVETPGRQKIPVAQKAVQQKEFGKEWVRLEAKRKAKEAQLKAQAEKETQAKKEKAAKQAAEAKAALEKVPLKEKKEEKRNIFYISGGYDTNHIHYREFSGSDTLNRDYGGMDGFYITAGYKYNHYIKKLLGKPFIEGYFRRSEDLITYDGRVSTGQDLKFNQRSSLRHFGIKLGASRDFTKKGELLGYLDVGKRIWYLGENEVINGTLSYTKKYYWTYLGLGAGINYKLTPRFFLGVEAEGLFSPSFSTRMRADLYEGGTFHLGGAYGVDIKAPLKYYFFKNLSLDLTPYYTYWRINKSKTLDISGTLYQEPKNKTHIRGLLVGLTHYF